MKTLCLRLLVRRSSLVQFREHFRSEGIAAVLPREAAVLQRTGTCIACGRCDEVVRATGDRDAADHPSLMRFVLAGTRSLPDYDASAKTLERFSDADLERAEQLCPVAVPIVDWARLVRNHRRT